MKKIAVPISLAALGGVLFMWRKLTAMLFLFVLAQTANALSMPEFVNLEPSSQHVSIHVQQQDSFSYHNDDLKDSFNYPSVNRLNSSLFATEVQTTPNYVLAVEFFKLKLNAGLFKHLANPPVTLHWFEQLSHNAHSTRLSGWKDGNLLYSSRVTYHS